MLNDILYTTPLCLQNVVHNLEVNTSSTLIAIEKITFENFLNVNSFVLQLKTVWKNHHFATFKSPLFTTHFVQSFVNKWTQSYLYCTMLYTAILEYIKVHLKLKIVLRHPSVLFNNSSFVHVHHSQFRSLEVFFQLTHTWCCGQCPKYREKKTFFIGPISSFFGCFKA